MYGNQKYIITKYALSSRFPIREKGPIFRKYKDYKDLLTVKLSSFCAVRIYECWFWLDTIVWAPQTPHDEKPTAIGGFNLYSSKGMILIHVYLRQVS